MNQLETSTNERASVLAKLANNTANELLRLKPNEEELILFFKRLQVVDPLIQVAKEGLPMTLKEFGKLLREAPTVSVKDYKAESIKPCNVSKEYD